MWCPKALSVPPDWAFRLFGRVGLSLAGHLPRRGSLRPHAGRCGRCSPRDALRPSSSRPYPSRDPPRARVRQRAPSFVGKTADSREMPRKPLLTASQPADEQTIPRPEGFRRAGGGDRPQEPITRRKPATPPERFGADRSEVFAQSRIAESVGPNVRDERRRPEWRHLQNAARLGLLPAALILTSGSSVNFRIPSPHPDTLIADLNLH